MTQDGLESKRERLDDLEKSEREATRLEEALGRGRASSIHPPPRSPTQVDGEDEGQIIDAVEAREPQDTYLPPHPGPNPARRKASSPGMSLLSALSYTLHGMMDVDPETARRNGISKTRETISSVHSLSSFYSPYFTYRLSFTVGGCSAAISARSQVFELDYPGRFGSLPTTKSR
jgi:sorting nexin-4